jgi:hypothetical protein
MRTFILMKGFYEGLRARRLEVYGRLELLEIMNDPPPYWFIRLYGKERPLDARYWDGKDTGLCWRLTELAAARLKFAELCSQPEYIQEAEKARNLSEAKRQRALEGVRSGKLKPFKPLGATTEAKNEQIAVSEQTNPAQKPAG